MALSGSRTEQRYINNDNDNICYNHNNYYQHFQAPDGIIREPRQNSATLGPQQRHRSEVSRLICIWFHFFLHCEYKQWHRSEVSRLIWSHLCTFSPLWMSTTALLSCWWCETEVLFVTLTKMPFQITQNCIDSYNTTHAFLESEIQTHTGTYQIYTRCLSRFQIYIQIYTRYTQVAFSGSFSIQLMWGPFSSTTRSR